MADKTTEASWVPVAMLGEFTKAGRKFEITPSDVAGWKASAQTGRVLVDVDHASAQGRTKAMGWLRDVRLAAGGLVEGLVAWTQAGRAAVQDHTFKFMSAEFHPGGRLVAVSLTNRPFLPLPAIQLSSTPCAVHAPSVRLTADAVPEPALRSLRLRDLHRMPGVDADELRAAEAAEAAADAGEDPIKAYEREIGAA